MVAACIACRKKKIKCSGGRPACQHCLRLNILCEYPVVRSRGSRLGYTEQLNQRLQALRKYYRHENGENLLQDVGTASPSAAPGDAHNLIRSVKRPPQSPESQSAVSNGNDSTDSLADVELPPMEVVVHLVELYFKNVNTQPYSFLHKPTFMARIRANKVSKALIFAVCSVAARFSKHPAITNSNPPYTFGEGYAAKARWLIGYEFDIPSLEIVQALICLIQHEFFRSRGGKAMIYISMAIPLAINMGLQREPDETLPWLERECRRRTFWSLVVMDRLGHSTPHYAVQLSEIYDVRLPSPLHLFLSNIETTVPFYGEMGPNVDLSRKGIFAYHIESIIIWNNINRYAAGAYKKEKTPPWELGSQFQTLLKQLDSFYESIPPRFKYSRTRLWELAGIGRAGHYIHFHSALTAARFVLFRTMYPYDFLSLKFNDSPPKQFVEDAALKMRQAANELSALVADMFKIGDISVAPFTAFCVFTVSPLHIALSFSEDPQVSAAAKQNLAYNMKLLVELREYYYVAGVWCVILKDSYVQKMKNASFELSRPETPPSYLPEDLMKHSGVPPSAIQSRVPSPDPSEPSTKKFRRSEFPEIPPIELLQDDVLTEPWLKRLESNNFVDLSTLYSLGLDTFDQTSPKEQNFLDNILLQIPVESLPEFGLEGS